MPLTATVDADNARVDLFVNWAPEAGSQTVGTLTRRVGHANAPDEYVRGLFGTTLLGEQAYVSDHEAPLDAQIWYVATADNMSAAMVAGPLVIPSNGAVWLKDPGRPWADLELDLCASPTTSLADCPAQPVISDTFTRVVASAWGTADTGQAWVTSGGAAADYSVNGTAGVHAHPAVNTAHLTSIAVTAADQDVVTTISASAVALTASLYGGPVVRLLDANNYYWARLTFTTTGALQMALRRRLTGVETGIGPTVTLPFAYVANQRFRVRLQIQGTTLRVRVWPEAVPESTNWDLTYVDSGGIVLSGNVGVRTLQDAASTNVAPSFSSDNFQYSPLVAPPVTVAWVGFRDKSRASDAGLFPVLDDERPSDVFARRKDIETDILFLSRTLTDITNIYELFTAGGPLLVQVPAEYGMNAPYGQRDRYYQPGDLREAYIAQDQRKPYRLWSAPAVSVAAPIGEPQGTDTANWCAIRDNYATFAQLTATGLTWGQIAAGDAV